MSRIRNRLRFQTPEERVLNALLVVMVGVLIVVGVNKLREDRAVAAPEVRGVQVERSTTTSTRPPVAATSATTTTTTIDPQLILWYAVASQSRPATTGPATTADPAAPSNGFPTPSTTRPTSTTTTKPRPATTSTSTTTSTTSTTTTTSLPVILAP